MEVLGSLVSQGTPIHIPCFSAKPAPRGWRGGWLMGVNEPSSKVSLPILWPTPVGRLGCRPSASQQELLGVWPAEA